jgi:hypothetical protein
VIAGDLNADPEDGDGMPGAVAQLLRHPRVDAGFVPRSEGAVERAADHALPRKGHVSPRIPATSARRSARYGWTTCCRRVACASSMVRVFWPAAGLLEDDPTTASDHHLVWLDVVSTSP